MPLTRELTKINGDTGSVIRLKRRETLIDPIAPISWHALFSQIARTASVHLGKRIVSDLLFFRLSIKISFRPAIGHRRHLCEPRQ